MYIEHFIGYIFHFEKIAKIVKKHGFLVIVTRVLSYILNRAYGFVGILILRSFKLCIMGVIIIDPVIFGSKSPQKMGKIQFFDHNFMNNDSNLELK